VVILLSAVSYVRGCIKYRRSKVVVNRQSRILEALFKTFLTCSLVCRITWCLMKGIPQLSNEEISFIFSRASFAFFFSAFTLVVFYWAESVHKTYYASEDFLPTIGLIFIITNGLLWVFQITIVVLYLLQPGLVKTSNILYESNILTDIVLSFLISIGFMIYGVVLSRKKYKADVQNPRRMINVVKTVLSAVIFVLCFLLRVVMFSYRPITNGYLDPDIFQVFAYFVPEIIPSIFQIYIAESSKGISQRGNRFIDDLYAEQVDSTIDEALLNPDYATINHDHRKSSRLI